MNEYQNINSEIKSQSTHKQTHSQRKMTIVLDAREKITINVETNFSQKGHDTGGSNKNGDLC
jgi:hypothetical protein